MGNKPFACFIWFRFPCVSNLTGTVNYTTAAQPTALTAGQIGVYSVATTGALTLLELVTPLKKQNQKQILKQLNYKNN